MCTRQKGRHQDHQQREAQRIGINEGEHTHERKKMMSVDVAAIIIARAALLMTRAPAVNYSFLSESKRDYRRAMGG